MTEVTTLMLDAPKLMLGKSVLYWKKINNWQWNMNGKTVLEGKKINNWGIILFSNKWKKLMNVKEKFKEEMITRFQQLGIDITVRPLFSQSLLENPLNDEVSWRAH